ncbi:hypothetical protein Ahy_B02g061159 isoform B [Arachis hypogaea]|uniref:Alpha 1,4-glycosyltransferase domain-containing protein n=1 Tax=Arachis hypogaea TaxID=3818 RepID=A0A445AKE0_ARAHY|nr:hypothetical protein Ahy_B02g061159 isoform B [Arachis hypogaea]
MFDPRHLKSAKLLLSSLFIFSAIIFVIHAYSINYHDFLHSATNKEPSENLQAQSHRFKEQIRSTLSNLPLHSIQEENVRIQAGNQNDLVAPLGVTELERIAWFRKNLHKFDILKSNNSTRRFHSRVLEFFSRECEAQFFMTWISPAGSFGVRELMSVESVFKVHPGACLVILSRTLETTDGYTVLKPLLDSRFKVQVVTPDLPILFKGTPAEAWFRELIKGKKDPGLRNSIGAQSMDLRSKHWTRLNNAVLIFDMKHPLLHEFISEFALTFDGNKWGHNGPYLVSRVIKRLLKRPSFIFKILPPMAFYPADWNKIRGFLRKPKTQTESKWVEAKVLQLCAETYGIHLWNKQSRRLTIEDGSVIGKLALNHCVICNHIFSS